MSKFNKARERQAERALRRPAAGPIRTTYDVPDTLTFGGGPGYTRDPKSDLFLLAVVNMVGEDTFYEKAGDRDLRYADLCRTVAVQDPQWFVSFVGWLRNNAYMRSASIVAAAVGADAMRKARVDQPVPGYKDRHVTGAIRALVSSALQRADEPGEFLAFWRDKMGHRSIPGGVQRGVADAVNRLYNEFSLLKYDSTRAGYRFGDVIDLVHPVPDAQGMTMDRKSALFQYALDVRHGRDNPRNLDRLDMIAANKALMELPVPDRRALLEADPVAAFHELQMAGMTWEAVSGWIQGPMTAKVWESIIPAMGYMALLRNLRNFDEAGVSVPTKARIVARLTNPEQVARSMQFPYRFLSAFDAVNSVTWSAALEIALQESIKNIPSLPGSTLVLVDTSASMGSGVFSVHSKMTPVRAGALFGVALAAKGEKVDLCGFADGVFTHQVRPGASVLLETQRFCRRIGEVGHGTQMIQAVDARYRDHDRIVLVSDMQIFPAHGGSVYGFAANVDKTVPPQVPIYGFNLAGYAQAALPSKPNRYEFGGLTDATFKMIPLLERGERALWPWENAG